MTIRKRGNSYEADYTDRNGTRVRKAFSRRKDAIAHHQAATGEPGTKKARSTAKPSAAYSRPSSEMTAAAINPAVHKPPQRSTGKRAR